MVMIQQMIILFIIMLVGYLAYRIHIITKENSKKFTSLVVNIANPCFILSGVTADSNSVREDRLILILGIAIAMYVVLILLGMIIPVILRVPPNTYGIYRGMTVFSNIGFIGLPVVSGIYGKNTLLYAAVFVLPYNLLVYTYGVYLMKNGSPKDGKIRFQAKLMFNPGVIATLLAIVIYVLQLNLPYVIISSVDIVGSLTVPLSMMIIGASFATMNIAEIFKDIKLLMFSGIKLLIIPIIGVFLIKMVVHDSIIYGICIIMLATPVGSMVPMLSQVYGGEYELGARGVAVTSVLSIITITIVSIIAGI